MNRKLLAQIRSWKPVRARAQIDLADILQDRFVLFVTKSGYLTIFDTEIMKLTKSKQPVMRREEGSSLPISDYFGTGVYSVPTEEEAIKLRDLLCFETEGKRWRFYWVRNTGIHAVAGGPQFAERHTEWVAAHIYKVWKKYVDPDRRRAIAKRRRVIE